MNTNNLFWKNIGLRGGIASVTTDDKKILSIEKWKDEIEVSIGKVIKSSKIKILKEFEQ